MRIRLTRTVANKNPHTIRPSKNRTPVGDAPLGSKSQANSPILRVSLAEVATVTENASCAFAAAVIDAGVTVHVPGKVVPAHVTATAPANPPLDVRSRLNVAVLPMSTDTLVPPLATGPSSKSSAVPDSATFIVPPDAFD
jgi:hypothetical protein